MTWHVAVTLTRQEQKGAMHRTPGTIPPNRLSSPVNGLPTDRPQGQVRPPHPKNLSATSHAFSDGHLARLCDVWQFFL